jgi:integrase-like protein
MKTTFKSDRITLNELNRLADNLSHSKNKTDKKIRIALLLQFYTSLRFGDCTRITFDSIINNNKFDLTEEKTKKTKTITVNPKLKKEVTEYYNSIDVPMSNPIIDFSIQYANRKLKEYKYRHNVKNYSNDSKFNFSTHSTRKCSLYEIYKRAGINVSLKISNHSSIDVHLGYICAEDDVKDAYLCL